MNCWLTRCVTVVASFSALITTQVTAQTCPFDDGNSSIEVEGLILTRYALGLTGAPLVANTGINAVDAPTVEASINCPSCGLNITGNPTMTVADATIISRKLAGFSGSALTDNLNLGSGTRNTPAAVQSFLLAGCGATGGTVTSIIAGSGLTGGTITTSGTIAADTSFLQRRLSSTCSAGSFITGVAADGTVSCGASAGSAGGTVTSVATSNGILGGPITATGTLSADTSFLQRRVATGCAVGSFITAIAVDGTPTCGTPAGSAGGTVTNIATGSGLTGGPITSTGTINLTANQLLPTTACASGQVPKWNGSAWACAADATGGSGTVTSVATGAGLTGGPISTTGTIALTANQLLPTTACASGQVAKWNGTAWACAADDAGPANAFVQGGNTFALGAGVASVLGNNDNRSLTIKAPQSTVKLLVDPANGDDGLRITYVSDGTNFGTSPNIINGSRGNSVAAAVNGATIAGGGHIGGGNQVTAFFGSVGGGYGNVAGQNAVVAGGFRNQATGYRAAVGGGDSNVASGFFSTIPGGANNLAAGQFSFAAGASAKANHDGAFVWGDNISTETASTGNNQFVIRATGGIRLPGAGENQPGNAAKASGTNMFTHVVPTTGPCNNTGPFGLSRTAIDHPLTNGKADAILVVTANFGSQSAGGPGYTKPVVVFYDDAGTGFCTAGRWVIANPNGDQNMVAGMKFNVFVINPQQKTVGWAPRAHAVRAVARTRGQGLPTLLIY